MVKVKPTANQGRITIRPNNDTTVFGVKDNLSEYYAKLAERWANSPDMVNGIDYSSKYYAEQSKASAQIASDIKSETQALVGGFDNNVQIAKDDIEQNRINSINAIDNTCSVALGDMHEKSDEVLTSIEALKDEAIDSINSTKTTILNDIEFIADGEKKEIEYLVDEIKDSGNTVNTAIEAGIKRLNSINALNKSQITNCITEIPQRIKYTLEEGVLTINASSVVIYPFGATNLTAQYPKGTTFLNNNLKVYDTQYIDGKFFVWAELQNDTSCGTTQSTMDNRTVWFNPQGGVNTGGGDFLFSGTTTPTGDYAVWYDTTRNIITRTMDGGATWTDYQSFPVAVGAFTRDYGFNSVQVFNGMGYIGSTIWIDKGVKALIPNGRNEDGTLDNIEVTTNKIATSISTSTQDYTIRLSSAGTLSQRQTRYNLTVKTLGELYALDASISYHVYVIDENRNYYTSNSQWNIATDVRIITATLTNGAVSNFNPKQPFRAVDWYDLEASINDLEIDIDAIVPAGAILSSASSTSPTGYLLCNGSAVSRTTYAKLFSAIGTTYGAGDGSTTFNLPNYSNYNFVTSATVSVLGNGKALGLTTDGGNAGLATASDARLIPYSTAYNKNAGVSSGSTLIAKNQTTIGVIKNASASGLTGTVTTKKLNWYIKY